MKNIKTFLFFVSLSSFCLNGQVLCDTLKETKNKNVSTIEVFDAANGCKLKSRKVITHKNDLQYHTHIVEWYENGKKKLEIKRKTVSSRKGWPSSIKVHEVISTWDTNGKEVKETKDYSTSNF